ncbi:hypothetical protein BSQ33_00940 [Vibrio gazogenes]|uniref:Transposase n=1 Tax=Vibrio gazogenes TaxID=687 RepID=A0A1Z2SBD0_VIBGA|nr:hypothetical protein BSQ33_00940 [Vibrio gazogenes]
MVDNVLDSTLEQYHNRMKQSHFLAKWFRFSEASISPLLLAKPVAKRHKRPISIKRMMKLIDCVGMFRYGAR